jgi:hypothetical protein
VAAPAMLAPPRARSLFEKEIKPEGEEHERSQSEIEILIAQSGLSFRTRIILFPV